MVWSWFEFRDVENILWIDFLVLVCGPCPDFLLMVVSFRNLCKPDHFHCDVLMVVSRFVEWIHLRRLFHDGLLLLFLVLHQSCFCCVLRNPVC